MARISKKLKKEIVDVRQEIRDKTAGYIVTALGLVAGLAWNEAIRSCIEFLFPANKSSSVWAKFIYAILITLVVVFISFYIVKFFKSNKEEGKEDKTKAAAKPKAETKIPDVR